MVMNVANALSAYRQTMSGASSAAGAKTAAAADGASFTDALNGFVDGTVTGLQDAEKAAAEGTLGKANVQDIVMAMTKAEVDFNVLVSLRDKFISAYQEVMRTSI